MKINNVYHSKEDRSVNFVFDNWQEARFVRRVPEYFIVYLSSHDGCNKACRFCHLTQTRQTSFNEATLENYLTQARAVLEHYDSVKEQQGAAQVVNFNFMARGEPLANSVILNNAPELFSLLEELATQRGLKANFNVSSIFPKELEETSLVNVFKDVKQSYMIYYSLYSVESSFRKRWLPKSMSPIDALKQIEEVQRQFQSSIAFHWAFIKGENDSKESIDLLTDTISQFDIRAKFNLVRYNPYSITQGEEPSEEVLQARFNQLNEFFNNPQSRIVPRVGKDVCASCGMFVEQD